VNGREADDHQNDAPTTPVPYWRRTFLEKILPDVIKNLLTALLIWLGAVLTGYIRTPSPTVLATIVLLVGGSSIAVGVIYIRSSERFKGEIPLAMRYFLISLAVIILSMAGLYTFRTRGQDPYWVLTVWVYAPTVAALILSEVIVWLKRGSVSDAAGLEQRRRRLANVAVAWSMVAAIGWWIVSNLRWGTASPLPAMLLVAMGALYFLTLYRRVHVHEGWLWLLRLVIALILILLVYRIIV
jgi:hypothetical protein